MTSKGVQFKLEESLLTVLRDKDSTCAEFQSATKKLAHFLVLKACEHIQYEKKVVVTPCGVHEGLRVKRVPILVPVLRAGLSLLPVFQDFFTGASVGFIGIKRYEFFSSNYYRRDEETALPVVYYLNFPKITPHDSAILLEPMLATGGTLTQSVKFLKKRGMKEENITICSVVVAKEGVDFIAKNYPKVKVVYSGYDVKLNHLKYIVPGLGDFGDRFFGNEGEPIVEEMKQSPMKTKLKGYGGECFDNMDK